MTMNKPKMITGGIPMFEEIRKVDVNYLKYAFDEMIEMRVELYTQLNNLRLTYTEFIQEFPAQEIFVIKTASGKFLDVCHQDEVFSNAQIHSEAEIAEVDPLYLQKYNLVSMPVVAAYIELRAMGESLIDEVNEIARRIEVVLNEKQTF